MGLNVPVSAAGTGSTVAVGSGVGTGSVTISAKGVSATGSTLSKSESKAL